MEKFIFTVVTNKATQEAHLEANSKEEAEAMARELYTIPENDLSVISVTLQGEIQESNDIQPSE